MTDVGEVRVESDLLDSIRRRLKAAAEAPEPKAVEQRRSWILSRVSALNTLARIESGELTPRFWRPGTGEPDWVMIPAGAFSMGIPDNDPGAFDDEKPVRRVDLPAYRIARVPITNAQYSLYVKEAQIDPPEHWRGSQPPQGKEDHPVVYINWPGAQGYCRWLSEKLGQVVRLPTEAEWEKAARGDQDLRRYPWGNTWDVMRCNSGELGLGDTSPVGIFSSGASPYGVLDMAGNVFEWCQSRVEANAYDVDDDREDPLGESSRVLRGGSFLELRGEVLCGCRNRGRLDHRDGIGFRVVLVANSR